MVVNKWTEKIEELEKENKGYETAYTRAVLKNEKIKKYLDKGTQLGNGLGTFYQITQERR